MALSNVAILGATGNLGSSILEALLSAKTFKITILTMSSISDPKFTPYQQQQLKIIQVDYSNEEQLVKAFGGIDAVIVCINHLQLKDQPVIVQAALKAGVKRIIPSEFGLDTTDPAVYNHPVFILLGKPALHKQLKEASSQGLTYTIILTGAFLSWMINRGIMLGFDVKSRTATIYNDGTTKFVGTELDQIGQFVVAVLQNPEKTKNKVCRIGTAVTSQQEILSYYEKKSGNLKWTVKHATTQDLADKSNQEFAKGNNRQAVIHGLSTLIFSGNCAYQLDEDLLGVHPISLEQIIDRTLQ
jgi:uncharacterized protein YbjT (DUF2867 family)